MACSESKFTGDKRERIKKFILFYEGGYGTDGRDGGCTMKGVTLTTYRGYFGNSKTCQDLKNIPDSEWDKIFDDLFYLKYKGDKINDSNIALLLIQWFYNAGNRVGVVRKALGLPEKGGMNNEMLDRLNSGNAHETFNTIHNAIKQWYYDITEKNPSNKKYIKGWMNRLNAVKWE